MMDELRGRRCVGVRRFGHRFRDLPLSETGPIEFTWDDGARLTLDGKADWTLDVSRRPWVDPYAGVAGSQRSALAVEVGLWEEAPLSRALERVVGQVLIADTPLFNEVVELTGLTLTFVDQVVVARLWGGELTVGVLDVSSPSHP